MSPKLEQLADAIAPLVAERVATEVADRLAEILAEREQGAPTTATLTAAEVAERLGVQRETVYAMADQLGAVRLGEGKRPRLRFPVAAVDSYLAGPDGGGPEQPKRTKPKVRRRSAASVELLPIRETGS